MPGETEKDVVIIGAGPAGLTAAYQLCKAGMRSVILEKDTAVGGISKTVNYKGYHFDIGGHRFFTKVKAVEDMWREVLSKGQMLRRSRLSRIYYNKKFFYYPLRATNALFGLGIWNSCLIVLSYLWAQVFPVKPEDTFEQWVSNRFGNRLYTIFFKTYTEKVWGIPCSEITADWAAQRIKGLSLSSAVKSALIGNGKKNGNKGDLIKTLIDEFDYPERGPGMMWETVTQLVTDQGSEVLLKADVEKLCWQGDKITGLEISVGQERKTVTGQHFISSMPIRELVWKLEPAPPVEVLKAANMLNYRDFLTVALIIDQPDLFKDNWIYIHDPAVKIGRIQNFKNWSPHMVPDQGKTCLGLEYFCQEGDGLWTMSDKDLIELGKAELELLKLVKASDVIDGSVVRMPKAYPVYDSTYADALVTVREFISQLGNLHLVGRNGLHKYNNQDHSMLTAMLVVKNILGAHYDIWSVNADQEYHEEVKEGETDFSHELAVVNSTQPIVPQRVLP